MIDEENVSIFECPRCGKAHIDIVLRTFKKPVIGTDGTIYDQYTTCPETNEPIISRHLIEIEEKWE